MYAAIGRRAGQRRKVVVIVIYVPPYYNADQNKSLFKYVNDAIQALKNKYDDPYVFVGGDFNRRNFKLATSEHPEIKEINSGATRGSVSLDIIGSNTNDILVDNGTVEPICNEDGIRSDHQTVFSSFRMPRVPSYTIENYTYRHLSEASHHKFGRWLDLYDWQRVTEATRVDDAVGRLHGAFQEGLELAYELKRRKKKSSEPEWMTDGIRNEIANRRKIFRKDKKRSDRWKVLKKRTNSAIKTRRKGHDEHILAKFESESNPGKFFQLIKSLAGKNTNQRWSPTAMYPGVDARTVADNLAAYFNSISSQYEPLLPDQIPTTFSKPLPALTTAAVEERMKKAKKPTSTVPGDIPAVLYNMYAAKLAPVVTHVFNRITASGRWPTLWKTEYVTVIPKIPNPQEPSECRNIACTNFLSKLYESFVLGWSRETVVPKLNQYGGEPKASAAHLLIEVMSDITTALEDNRAGVVVSGIDFSKAFNRLDHAKCLRAFAKKGAPSEIIQMIASFLSGRNMMVRLEGVQSTPLQVNAGAPQGSVLGCYLFNVGVDDLEEGFDQNKLSTNQQEAHQETLGSTADFPAASTPQRIGPTRELHESPIPERRQAVAFLPRVANVPLWYKKPKDPTFVTGQVKTYKFVDDEVNTSKVNMKQARLLVEEETFFKEVVDLRTQGLLQHIADRAKERGMAINASKTNLMLVSAATSFTPRTRVELDGETVRGSDKIKILGITIDSDASFKTHINNISNKLRSKTWSLTKLRKRGLQEEKLIKVYKSLVRPTAEYACAVWHSSVTAAQAAELERQQTLALRNIFGPNLSAAKMRDRAKVELLSKRRECSVKKFAHKNINNPRSQSWFRERHTSAYPRRASVCYPTYQEETARTDRHRNNPMNYLVRKANEV